MKIATFNVNGIKARLPALIEWLNQSKPDACVLQEIKTVDEDFPREALEDADYNVETHGQKGFNGVAILSRRPIEDVARGLPGGDGDEQARWIEGTIVGDRGALRLCGLYLPNGNPAPGPKFDYKLAWMERLAARAAELRATEEPVAMLGDYNVIPEPRDAKRPEAWVEDALFRPESRAAWRRIVNAGWTDALRAVDDGEVFTFWDYQAGAWRRNDGIRIDHALLSPQAADRLTGCGVDKGVRGGDKPSDHAPLWVTLDL
jgi:exodeoxyribonuclease-3